MDFALLLGSNISRGKMFEWQLNFMGLIAQELKPEECDLIVLNNNAPLRIAYHILKHEKNKYL